MRTNSVNYCYVIIYRDFKPLAALIDNSDTKKRIRSMCSRGTQIHPPRNQSKAVSRECPHHHD